MGSSLLREDFRVTQSDDAPVIRAAICVFIKERKLKPEVAMKAIQIYHRLKPKNNNG